MAQWVLSADGYGGKFTYIHQPRLADTTLWLPNDWLTESSCDVPHLYDERLVHEPITGFGVTQVLFRPYKASIRPAEDSSSLTAHFTDIMSGPMPPGIIQHFCAVPKRTYLFFDQDHYWRVFEATRAVANDLDAFSAALDDLCTRICRQLHDILATNPNAPDTFHVESADDVPDDKPGPTPPPPPEPSLPPPSSKPDPGPPNAPDQEANTLGTETSNPKDSTTGGSTPLPSWTLPPPPRAQRLPSLSLYEILAVPTTATTLDIKSAYHSLVRAYHPDRNKDPRATEYVKAVNSAYETLRDDLKRTRYDIQSLPSQVQATTTPPRTSQRSPRRPSTRQNRDNTPTASHATKDSSAPANPPTADHAQPSDRPSRRDPSVRRPSHNFDYTPKPTPLPEPTLPPLPAQPAPFGWTSYSHSYQPPRQVRRVKLLFAPCQVCNKAMCCIPFAICIDCLRRQHSLRIVDESKQGRGLGLQACATIQPGHVIAPYSDIIHTAHNLDDLPNSEYLVEHSYGRSSDGRRWLPQDLSDDDLATMRAANRARAGTYVLYYQDASQRRWFGGLANHDNHSSAEIVHLDPTTALTPMHLRMRPSRTLQAGEALTVCYLARRTVAANNFTFGGQPGETRYVSQPIHRAYRFPTPDQPFNVQPVLPRNFSLSWLDMEYAKLPEDPVPVIPPKPLTPNGIPANQHQPTDKAAHPMEPQRSSSIPRSVKIPNTEGQRGAVDHPADPVPGDAQVPPTPRQPRDDPKAKPQQGPYWTRATLSSKPAPRPQPKGPSGPTPGNFFTSR